MTRRRPLQSRGPEPAWGELPSVWCSRRAARANFPLLLPSSSLPPPPVFSAPSVPSPCMSDFPRRAYMGWEWWRPRWQVWKSSACSIRGQAAYPSKLSGIRQQQWQPAIHPADGMEPALPQGAARAPDWASLPSDVVLLVSASVEAWRGAREPWSGRISNVCPCSKPRPLPLLLPGGDRTSPHSVQAGGGRGRRTCGGCARQDC